MIWSSHRMGAHWKLLRIAHKLVMYICHFRPPEMGLQIQLKIAHIFSHWLNKKEMIRLYSFHFNTTLQVVVLIGSSLSEHFALKLTKNIYLYKNTDLCVISAEFLFIFKCNCSVMAFEILFHLSLWTTFSAMFGRRGLAFFTLFWKVIGRYSSLATVPTGFEGLLVWQKGGQRLIHTVASFSISH